MCVFINMYVCKYVYIYINIYRSVYINIERGVSIYMDTLNPCECIETLQKKIQKRGESHLCHGQWVMDCGAVQGMLRALCLC